MQVYVGQLKEGDSFRTSTQPICQVWEVRHLGCGTVSVVGWDPVRRRMVWQKHDIIDKVNRSERYSVIIG